MLRIFTIVGARPQFIKAATVSRAIMEHNRKCAHLDESIIENIIHTGQHFDANMSDVFFSELSIPEPLINLNIKSGSHGQQTSRMLEKIENALIADLPDIVLLYGDTNSTLAGALAASKLNIRIVHVEAGLRSFNRQMPEEVNRVITDHVSNILFCPTETAVANLRAEGITEGVFNVGDVMYDSALYFKGYVEQKSNIIQVLNLRRDDNGTSVIPYILSTIHRPENTDNPKRLKNIFDALGDLHFPVILPLHPRTRHAIARYGLRYADNVILVDPLSYLDMIMLEQNAHIILTDSGGVQKEAYFFGIPCVTMRDQTEWVETVEAGCNTVTGANRESIVGAVNKYGSINFGCKFPDIYGDGKSAKKIIETLLLQQENRDF